MAEMEQKGLSDQTKELLQAYFKAFANLYGIIPLYRALRIIQKQNLELELTEEDFLSFVGEVEPEERYYIIAGAEDFYDDVEEKTPPMKREIVCEYLYALGGSEDYEDMKLRQKDKPFYDPDK